MSKKIIITGASSGIGMALTKIYDRPQNILGLFGRRKEALQSISSQLQAQCTYYPVDVLDYPNMEASAQDFIGRYGAPDIVIGNAGISIGTLTEIPEDRVIFEQVLQTNVIGLFNTYAPFISSMREKKQGTLVGIASVAGIRGLPGAGAYSASKAATIAYLEALRGEMRPYGIQVISILPGYIRTPMTEQNPYRMPFIIDADHAAKLIQNTILRGDSLRVIPWQMAIVAKLLRVLPNPIFDFLVAGQGRKPRAKHSVASK